jgi:hypothetical protein
LKEKEADIPDIVGESLIGHVVELSKQKFSSNVIEKVNLWWYIKFIY